jgi:hypothetical protein
MARPVGTRTPLADRLWAKVKIRRPDQCWLWQGGRQRVHGKLWYGQIQDGGKPGVSHSSRSITAHRAAWLTTFGPIPQAMEVLHSCDNPPCCNPAHLWLGTQADNAADMARKGRAKGRHNAIPRKPCLRCGQPCPRARRTYCSRACYVGSVVV